MPNRTIYVADEKLWNQAKNLAGKDGLSGVIASAVKNFVEAASRRSEGFEKFHFEIFGDPHLDGPTEVIGFEGKLLYSASFDLQANPFEQSDSARSVEAYIAVYRTKAGKFVALAEPVGFGPTSKSVFAIWETHSSVRDLMNGNIVASLFPPSRDEFLRGLTSNLGGDAVTWIE